MPSARTVISFGEALIDFIASDDATDLARVNTFAARPGGAPANAAVALARLGVSSAFCGVVGKDPFAARLRDTLAGEGVDLSRLRETNEVDTTIAFAWKDHRGDGDFRLLTMADRLLDLDDVERAGIPGAAAVIVGSVALAAEPSRRAVTRAVEIAFEHDVPVCFDVNMRPTLWRDAETARAACEPIFQRATLLKLSLDDARCVFAPGLDAHEALRRSAAFPAKFVVLTDGRRGAWCVTSGHNELMSVPAFSVDAIEPTGAGDAFMAAVINRLLMKRWSELTIVDLRFAAAAGALATTRRGAMEALPNRTEIERFLMTHG
jgi:sugar/nucleoside kinase (ribokinase family)